jgi:hypothetical protein
LALFVPLLIAALLLWRLVFLAPLLELSRVVVEVSFSLLPGAGPAEVVSVDSKGDWTVRPSAITSRETVVLRSGLQQFSVCLPIFWALTVAAGFSLQKLGRILGIGTLILMISSQISVVLFLVCDVLSTVVSSHAALSMINMVHYCLGWVVPYASPLVQLIWLDRQLRELVFGESRTQKIPAPGS